MSKVTVTADQANLVINQSSNPEFGWFRVESIQPVFTGKFVRMQKRSAIVAGKIEDLQSMNLVKGQQLPGKIVVVESLTPTNPNDLNQDIKLAGKGGLPCLQDGQPIYRTQEYTQDLTREDHLEPHTNADELQAAAKARSEEEHTEDVVKDSIIETAQ